MLTFEERQYLRHAISDHKRARLRKSQQDEPFAYCAGCGTEKTNYTPGCAPCHDRKRRNTGTTPCETCGTPIRNATLRNRKRHGWPSAGINKCRDCLKHPCAECGCPVDQRTEGCGTCRSRHHKRLLQHRAHEHREAA